MKAGVDGMQRFGWANRPPPRSIRDGNYWVGWGMATATYPAKRQKASASARYQKDGTAVVASGSQELGTGTYTVMSQVASAALGLSIANIRFQLGDSALPPAPVSGGSMTVGSVAPAIEAACEQARSALIRSAIAGHDSALKGAAAEDVSVADGWLTDRRRPGRRVRVAAVAEQAGAPIGASAEAEPGPESRQYAMHSFGAVFSHRRHLRRRPAAEFQDRRQPARGRHCLG